jgi:glucose-6-phosphate isomerase
VHRIVVTPGLDIAMNPETGEPELGPDVVFTSRGERLANGLLDVVAMPDQVDRESVQYWTVVEVSDGGDTALRDESAAYSLTFLGSTPLGGERSKTHGHVHRPGRTDLPDPEVYEVLVGSAIFLFQDLHPGPTSTVAIAVHAGAGDTVVIPPFMYHCSVNAGTGPLVFGDVCSRGLVDDYGLVKESHGFAYYFPVDGEPISNPRYAAVPPLTVLTAEEWCPQDVGPLYQRLRDDPASLSWLLDASEFAKRYPEYDVYAAH